MDNMVIKSKIFTGILSKIISRTLKKQAGIDCEIRVNEVFLSNDGEMMKVRVNVEGLIETSKIPDIVGKMI